MDFVLKKHDLILVVIKVFEDGTFYPMQHDCRCFIYCTLVLARGCSSRCFV